MFMQVIKDTAVGRDPALEWPVPRADGLFAVAGRTGTWTIPPRARGRGGPRRPARLGRPDRKPPLDALR